MTTQENFDELQDAFLEWDNLIEQENEIMRQFGLTSDLDEKGALEKKSNSLQFKNSKIRISNALKKCFPDGFIKK